MAVEHYDATEPRQLSYRYPAHARAMNLAAFAAQLTAHSSYNATLQAEPPRLLLRLKEPLKWLLSAPVFRNPDAIGVWYADPPLEDCTWWPQLGLSEPPQRLEAFNRLGGRRNVTLEWLSQFQNDLTSLLVRNDPVAMKHAIRSVIPILRRHFPTASIDCIFKLPPRLSAARVPLNLAQMQLLPIDEIVRRSQSGTKLGGPHYLTLDAEPYFSVISNLAYPHVSGFAIGHGDFFLYIDYGELPFLESASAKERDARAISAGLLSEDQTGKHLPITTTSSLRIHLRNWLTRALDRFFSQLAHPGTFASPQGRIDPDRQAHDMTTVSSIVEITNLLITESHPAIMRLLFFDLVDRYAALGGRTVASLLSTPFMTQLAASLDPLLGRFKNDAETIVLKGWNELKEALWNGLYDPNAQSQDTFVLSSPDGTPGPTYDRDSFASDILQVLRNTTHGHGLENESKRRLLARHNGFLPPQIRIVALSLWFGLISNPQHFWQERAQFDRVQRVARDPGAA